MKNALYFKFILAYVILGLLGILTISTLGSAMIQHQITEDTGEALYKEAISLASYQANANYDNPEEVEEAYNTLKTLALYENIRILILNPSGAPILDTGRPYSEKTCNAPESLIRLPSEPDTIRKVIFIITLRKI